MGLLNALTNAVSGLNVNQKNLDILSQNISNANTPNYSAEVVNQEANFINGQPEGVLTASVTREVNEFLNGEVQSQTSTNSSASTIQNYYSQIENLLGQPGSNDSIDTAVTSFFTALQSLANTPSVAGETTVANDASSLATQISGLANSLQGLRLQADQSITSAVSSVNTDLQNLYSINNGLELASATNQDNSGLLDQRDAALTDLAQYIDIKPSFQSNGEVTINTTAGVNLLSTNLFQLSYTGASSAQTFINGGSLSALTVSQLNSAGQAVGSPTVLATSGPSTGVTTSLTGGQIQGLLTMRDQVVPDILDQLDQLANTLTTQVNAVQNQGVSYPPSNSYTGSLLVSGNTTSQYSGNLRIAVLGSNGAALASPYADETNGLAPLTLNLSQLNYGNGNGVLSVDNIISAINQNYGPPQNKLELGSLNNVQLSIASNTVPDSNGNLNVGFNLNNISSKSANFYVTGVTVLDSSNNPISTTSTAPSVAISSMQATNTNTITITTSGTNTLTDGEQIYLPSTGLPASVGGVASSTFGNQLYTVSNVSGNTFQITVAGVSTTADSASHAVTATVLPPYATVGSGNTVNTQSNGIITANIGSDPSSFYTVQATVVSTDANGNPVTSTVDYQVNNNQTNVDNNLIGAASIASGGGTIVVPTTNQALATASLVDANGNPLTTTNGSYGTQQGYLKITAGNSTETIAIDELNSQQLGQPDARPPVAATNQGFSQYFGLNNFFNVNGQTTTGSTLANSALNMSVASNILTNPSSISSASLALGEQPTAAGAAPNFTYRVSSGDTSNLQNLAGLATSTISFASLGGQPASSTTLSQYAGQIIANTSTNSTQATNTATNAQTLLSGFSQRAQAVSGVNLDQELANTVVYQNAYSASARVISVIDQLFTQLIGIFQ